MFPFDEEEETLNVDGFTTPVEIPQAPPEQPPEMNPLVKDHIMKKFNLAGYGAEDRAKLAEDVTPGLGSKFGAALSAIGAGFQGQNAGEAGQRFLSAKRAEGQQALDSFDKNRANKIQEYDLNKKFSADAENDDPTSDRSRVAQELAKKMLPGMDFSNHSATKLNDMFPNASKIFQIEQEKLKREDDRQFQRDLFGEKQRERQDAKDLKREEKEYALKTPFGIANTEDDAKKLKEGYESKKNFDSKLEEMIDLRKKHEGGAILNRDDVGRGKQLSKDLLLEYKNMAKLGVLSQADENIINEIIPADPLEYNSPLAAIQGQDPILNKLSKFKQDSDKDFETRISTRTRDGAKNVPQKKDKQVVKTQTNKKTGAKRVVYSDGTIEEIDPVASSGKW